MWYLFAFFPLHILRIVFLGGWGGGRSGPAQCLGHIGVHLFGKKCQKKNLQIVSELKNVFALVSDDNQRSYSLKLIKDSGLNKW